MRGNSVKTIFDVGANIGQTSLYFNKHFPRADIYCFEPVKDTFKTLQDNVKHLQKVHPFNFGLGSKNDTLTIYMNDSVNSQIASLVNPNDTNANLAKTELVDIKTIDGFCQQSNIDDIDILKTDTEGFDLEVIRGATEKIKNKKIKFILSEVTFQLSDKTHTQFVSLLNHSFPEGFRFYSLYETCYHVNDAKGIFYSNALLVNTKVVNKFSSLT